VRLTVAGLALLGLVAVDLKLTRECGAIGLTLDDALRHALDGMRAVSAGSPP